jgi:hypothetical protein
MTFDNTDLVGVLRKQMPVAGVAMSDAGQADDLPKALRIMEMLPRLRATAARG